MSLARGFIVKRSGIMSLLQDAGRFGAFNLGLTNGGPVDKIAFNWANRLCRNAVDDTAIEITFGGLALIAQFDTVIAVTGANMPLTINGVVKRLWRSHHIKAGDIINLGFSKQGIRCYLAVAGGFTIEKSFGSTATVCREKIGGISGGKLEKNNVVSFASQQHIAPKNLFLPEQYWPQYSKEVRLRTILGYQQAHFSSHQQALFFSSEYTVSQYCDRMGYRLSGAAIHGDIAGILSEGISYGAVQIPADGQPIVLLNDRQTIGGYPKIGAVISLDIAKLGQLSQGAKVHFEAISMDKARDLYLSAIQQFNHINLVECD